MQLKEALELLEQIAFYLELKGENVFKINAFNNAVRNLSRYDISLEEAFNKEIIQNTKGVGKAIENVLQELLKTGKSSLLNELKRDFPESIYSLTSIRGLGAKKIKKLYDDLKISTVEELEQACIENKLSKIPGFGEKTQSSILENIRKIKNFQGKLLLHQADSIYGKILEELNQFKINLISATGELRLRSRVISRVEVIIGGNEFKKFIETKFKVVNHYNNSYEVQIDNARVIIHVVDADNFYYELFRTTGPEEFLQRVNFYSLKSETYTSESRIFSALKIPNIIPHLRENLSLELKLYDFAEFTDIKGLIHVHSNYSDGSNSIKEIHEYAEKNDYEYVLICDHSKSAFYANGLDEERLKQQWKEIDELNSKSNRVKILKGIECDILVDGSLDYDDELLSKFDCVIASVHSRFNLSKQEMTKRITNALKNKYVKILGHPTGRLLLSRDPYPVDLDEIINVAAQKGKSIELNCNPHRLDLDWEYHQKAKSKGIMITISPDAHSMRDLEFVKYGLDMAAKGGLEKKDISNCLSLNEFIKKFCKI